MSNLNIMKLYQPSDTYIINNDTKEIKTAPSLNLVKAGLSINNLLVIKFSANIINVLQNNLNSMI